MIADVPILFHDRGCPFAHRVIALAEHLGIDLERRQSLLGDKPAGVEQYSSSSAIPLLVDGDLVITESRVMLEHLAERYGFTDAYPDELMRRTRHRHAMAVTDEHLVPALMYGRASRRLDDALRALEQVIDRPPHPCLMTLHVAPIWLRFRLWRPTDEVTRAIEARPTLARWLDDAAALPCVARTAPDPETHARDLVRAREAGLLPS
jgi:glutathione S-transferase